MSITLKSRPTIVAPTKLSKTDAIDQLQQHVELMDLLRDVERRMARLTPRLDQPIGYTSKTFYEAHMDWEIRTAIVRTLYGEVERLAVAINLQAL